MQHIERRNDVVWAYAAVLTLLCGGMALGQASPEQVTGISVTLLMLGLLALTMSRLSIKSRGDALRISLGAGFFSRRLSRDDIASVRVVPSPSAFGVGLRLLPDGWLYSLRQTGAVVEIQLLNGSRLLIGSTEPEELAAQIWDFVEHTP
ncbi:MAG: hypothetical protein Q4C89_14715 [Deinococcus sp.]|uniref:hypothetical protein n=1 Tax=Deinococcus sp. TaxID=47478 RepID=UPI0026DA99D0|nr:hypothetical protein [Deinococcus sp.]MDO4247269.1 hypothetical protein [Deinococcus sp.]